MPPRLSKRELREQEELAQLAAAAAAAHAPASDASDDDDDVVASMPVAVSSKSRKKANKARASAFAALDVVEVDDDSEHPASDAEQAAVAKPKSKKKKKKPKGATSTIAPEDEGATTTSAPSTPANKSKAAAENDGMDEIDKALAEIAAKEGRSDDKTQPTSSSAMRIDAKWQAIKDVLAIDTKCLDADAELRKFFGSKVISAAPTQPRSMHHPRFANNVHHSTSIRRTSYFLAQPEPGWSAPGGVISLVRYDGPESRTGDGEWWTFQHSQTYREAQLGFLEVLQQADGERLYDILQAEPYHVDTLMQLSEMQAHQGDLGASSTYLAKALYALSSPLPSTFPNGSFRLSYAKIENRAFFLAIARKVAILVKRGTWRTACEWAKIGFGASGGSDPTGMLCFLDFLAPKAKQNKWFLEFLDALPAAYPSLRSTSYPGLAYAKAICLRNLEQETSQDDSQSTAALESAILKFPMVVTLLFTALGGTIPPKLLSHRRAQLDGGFTSKPSYMLSLLSELYSSRSSPLWKEPPLLAWLQKTVNNVATKLDDSTLDDVRTGERLWNEGPWPAGYAPAGIIRAVFISDVPALRPYLPPSARSGESYSYDPIPPPKGPETTFYDDTYFAPLYGSNRTRRRLPAQGAAPQNVIDLLREQMRGMTPEQEREFHAQMQAMLDANGVPGAFPGEDGDGAEDDDDHDDEDDEPNQRQAAQNMLQRVGALFGMGPAGPG